MGLRPTYEALQKMLLCLRIAVVVAALVFQPAVGGQAVEEAGGEEMVQLNFPAEIEIRALIDLVSQRLGIKILYDEQVANKRISVKAPVEIPASSLLPVLESALKMKGLALVDADAPGWKRIVTVERLANVAPQGTASDAIEQFGRGTAVTQAFVLRYANPQQVNEAITPFLTQPGSNSIVVADSRMLIITDYATNVLKIAQWIELLDRPRVEVVTEFVPVENVEATALAAQLTQILTARTRAAGVTEQEPRIEVSHDARTNQIVLVGPANLVEEAKKLIRALDAPLGLVTRIYDFANVSAERIDSLVRGLLDPITASRLYESSIDAEENILIVTTTLEIHERIAELVRARDVPPERARSPIRFYRIKNLPVTDVLQTIRAIEQQAVRREQAGAGQIIEGTTEGAVAPTPVPGAPSGEAAPAPAGASVRITPSGQTMPAPPTYRGPASQAPLEPQAIEAPPAVGELEAGSLLGRARIAADIPSNSLIVIAEPPVQQIYAELIERLDQRRPQVLIDAKLVIIDTSDDFTLGVEFSTGDGEGSRRILGFSSFGLSEVDPISGALSIIPGLGFNGTLVDPETADVVLRALATHRRSRVTSAPRILVNDNAQGTLTSVAEVPFTSLNASQTVATTSFAGFAQAGTTITVTPRISDESHLQLDFSVTLNTFTGSGGEGIPPPRQTDEVTSQITIPDGHTVIVGGLNRKSNEWSFTALPFVDQIPLLRYLGGSESKGGSATSMFVFIRPIVLRDDKFRDLKFLSERDVRCARVCPDYPTSEPLSTP